MLAVASCQNYTKAAKKGGYLVGDTVAHLVSRFNQEGMVALQPRHVGGMPTSYGVVETVGIFAEVGRVPDCGKDGTANWSLNLIKAAFISSAWRNGNA